MIKKRNRYFHIRRVVWNSQEIGISQRNWARLDNGYYAGIKVDQKLAGKTMYPGVYRIPTGTNRINIPSQLWKGTELYLFHMSDLEKCNEKKEHTNA
jgi:hypothetical protein